MSTKRLRMEVMTTTTTTMTMMMTIMIPMPAVTRHLINLVLKVMESGLVQVTMVPTALMTGPTMNQMTSPLTTLQNQELRTSRAMMKLRPCPKKDDWGHR